MTAQPDPAGRLERRQRPPLGRRRRPPRRRARPRRRRRCSPPPSLSPGDDVLDVGCGCGVTTLAAAPDAATRRHRAPGIDLSEPMLDRRPPARPATGRHVTFLQADAQTHRFDAGAYDVVDQPLRDHVLRRPRRRVHQPRSALRPGGRLCIATWQPLAANDWLHRPRRRAAALRVAPRQRQTPRPGMFAQSDPERVTEVLTAAGWQDVDGRRSHGDPAARRRRGGCHRLHGRHRRRPCRDRHHRPRRSRRGRPAP